MEEEDAKKVVLSLSPDLHTRATFYAEQLGIPLTLWCKVRLAEIIHAGGKMHAIKSVSAEQQAKIELREESRRRREAEKLAAEQRQTERWARQDAMAAEREENKKKMLAKKAPKNWEKLYMAFHMGLRAQRVPVFLDKANDRGLHKFVGPFEFRVADEYADYVPTVIPVFDAAFNIDLKPLQGGTRVEGVNAAVTMGYEPLVAYWNPDYVERYRALFRDHPPPVEDDVDWISTVRAKFEPRQEKGIWVRQNPETARWEYQFDDGKWYDTGGRKGAELAAEVTAKRLLDAEREAHPYVKGG